MSKKLFVSNIDFEITEESLRDMFTTVGPCTSVVMAYDRETKRSKGFAFVEMEKDDDAIKAIEALNNKAINGRPMKVVEDRGKASSVGGSPRASSGEGGGGGGRPEMLPPIARTQLFRRHKKLDPFMQDPTKSIDFKDATMLYKFLSERGRILSRRMTGLSSYNQRKVSKAIKRAQAIGLMPYTTVQK